MRYSWLMNLLCSNVKRKGNQGLFDSLNVFSFFSGISYPLIHFYVYFIFGMFVQSLQNFPLTGLNHTCAATSTLWEADFSWGFSQLPISVRETVFGGLFKTKEYVFLFSFFRHSPSFAFIVPSHNFLRSLISFAFLEPRDILLCESYFASRKTASKALDKLTSGTLVESRRSVRIFCRQGKAFWNEIQKRLCNFDCHMFVQSLQFSLTMKKLCSIFQTEKDYFSERISNLHKCMMKDLFLESSWEF